MHALGLGHLSAGGALVLISLLGGIAANHGALQVLSLDGLLVGGAADGRALRLRGSPLERAIGKERREGGRAGRGRTTKERDGEGVA